MTTTRRRENQVPFPPVVAEAIRGTKAAFGVRRAMTFNRMREWGGAEIKANGETWLIGSDGSIRKAD